jgi:hypothetical protein
MTFLSLECIAESPAGAPIRYPCRMGAWIVGAVVVALASVGFVVTRALASKSTGSGSETFGLGVVSQDWLKGRQADRRDDRFS